MSSSVSEIQGKSIVDFYSGKEKFYEKLIEKILDENPNLKEFEGLLQEKSLMPE